MVREAEDLGGLQCLWIYAVDDRAAVRAVLGDRNPDVLSVVVDAARVVDGALSELRLVE